jgi:ComF family protein
MPNYKAAKYLFDLFYPKICMSCGEALKLQENIICLKCELRLPKTGFHMHEDNPVSRVFWGRIDISAATSFLFFSKQGRVQSLIHNLKYKGQKDVGTKLGFLLGEDLKESPLFSDIDYVIAVPLHPKKLRKRGYNQSMAIAEGIAKSQEIRVFGGLRRRIHSSTQTKKTRYERWQNVKDIFELTDSDQLRNKKVLLVDDVLTTGATLEACASNLMEVDGIRVCVATLAYANN